MFNFSKSVKFATKLVTLVVVLFISMSVVYGSSKTTEKGIEISDLPKQKIIFSAKDGNHPLGWQSPLLKKITDAGVLEHKAYDEIAAFLSEEGIVVASYSYEYATNDEAEKASQVIKDDLYTRAYDRSVFKYKGREGFSYSLKGGAGDELRWFIIVKNRSVVLLFVNGFNSTRVNDRFEKLLTSVLTK